MIGDALQELLGLPGARYSCVADPVTGRVLRESGVGAGAVPGALLACGSGAARFLAEADGDDLDDLIVTSRRSYHLVRQIGTDASGRLLVYLCLDRARGNLAAARRELGSVRLHERITAGARVADRRALPSSHPVPPAAEPTVPAWRAAPPPAMPAASSVAAVPTVPAAPPGPPPSVSSRSAVTPMRLGQPEPAVPQQRSEVTALPRRSAATPPLPPPAPRPEMPPTVPAGLPGSGLTWADDVGTLRRLLAALRRMP